jgi:hypothetical protein
VDLFSFFFVSLFAHSVAEGGFRRRGGQAKRALKQRRLARRRRKNALAAADEMLSEKKKKATVCFCILSSLEAAFDLNLYNGQSVSSGWGSERMMWRVVIGWRKA